MDSDAWSRFTAAVYSKRHQSSSTASSAASHQSRYDPYIGFEETNGADEEDYGRLEFPCPFCSEDFDIIGLCFHIDDEHPTEANNEVCPICAAKVGLDMVGHITMQHSNFFKMQRRRRFSRGSSGAHSAFSMLRKELEYQSLLAGSSYMATSTAAADPFLSSLIYSLPVADASKDVQAEPLSESSLVSKSSVDKVDERPSGKEPLSDQDQEERARRSEFVQGLLLSTILENSI